MYELSCLRRSRRSRAFRLRTRFGFTFFVPPLSSPPLRLLCAWGATGNYHESVMLAPSRFGARRWRALIVPQHRPRRGKPATTHRPAGLAGSRRLMAAWMPRVSHSTARGLQSSSTVTIVGGRYVELMMSGRRCRQILDQSSRFCVRGERHLAGRRWARCSANRAGTGQVSLSIRSWDRPSLISVRDCPSQPRAPSQAPGVRVVGAPPGLDLRTRTWPRSRLVHALPGP